jgi:hypothetical protein
LTRLAKALAALRAGRHGRINLGAGDFKILGSPRRKPKHIEVLGRRKGEVCELHVEFEGHIRKSKHVAKDNQKWGPNLQGAV